MISNYRKTEVLTANRETLLLMLYAGAIRFLGQAIQAAEKGDAHEKLRLIGRTQEIVNELRATLDFKAGGEIATSLDALYAFVTGRLTEGGVKGDTQGLKEALDVLNTLNDAWELAIQQLRAAASQETVLNK
jgi:flagellar protein FliS